MLLVFLLPSPLASGFFYVLPENESKLTITAGSYICLFTKPSKVFTTETWNLSTVIVPVVNMLWWNFHFFVILVVGIVLLEVRYYDFIHYFWQFHIFLAFYI